MGGGGGGGGGGWGGWGGRIPEILDVRQEVTGGRKM